MKKIFLYIITLTVLLQTIQCSNNNQSSDKITIEYSVIIGNVRILCNDLQDAKEVAQQTNGKIEQTEILSKPKQQ